MNNDNYCDSCRLSLSASFIFCRGRGNLYTLSVRFDSIYRYSTKRETGLLVFRVHPFIKLLADLLFILTWLFLFFCSLFSLSRWCYYGWGIQLTDFFYVVDSRLRISSLLFSSLLGRDSWLVDYILSFHLAFEEGGWGGGGLECVCFDERIK